MRVLSRQGQTVLEAFKQLSQQDQAEIIKQGVTAVAAEVAEAAPTAAPNTRAKAQAALTQEVAENLITKAGGIFLGEKQLKELGVINQDATIPPIPEKFSTAFLNAAHPLRKGNIASSIILGFDPNTNAWHCFEQWVVPGSFGKYRRGLSASVQDRLLLDENLQPKIVAGMKYSSPTDCRPIATVLNNVAELFRKNEKFENIPFREFRGRTADTTFADPGCRVVLTISNGFFVVAFCKFPAEGCAENVGLLAGWN